MKCEICNTIERLGLDRSAHDLWFCCEHEQQASGRASGATLATILVKAATLPRVACDLFLDRCKHLIGAGLHSLPAYRRHYTTLEL